jgi:hypothetical protein
VSRPGRFIPGERARGTHWIGGWVGPRTGLDDVERTQILALPGLEFDPSAVQPVASLYTDCAIPASVIIIIIIIITTTQTHKMEVAYT